MIFFFFLNENICCGYSLEAPQRGASNEYPQHTFLLRNKKNTFWLKKCALPRAMVVIACLDSKGPDQARHPPLLSIDTVQCLYNRPL